MEEDNICDGVNHHVKVDFITFISHPDSVTRQWVNGTTDTVIKTIKQYQAAKAPDVDMFIDYCCEACKEASNG